MKKTTTYPLNSPSQQSVVRLENASIDRTGAVARFLRLAFRINMEQHKLVGLDQPPPARRPNLFPVPDFPPDAPGS